MDSSRAVALRAGAHAWWPTIAVAIACALLGPHATTLLCALLSECALRAFLMRLPTRPGDRPAISAAFLVALPLQYALVWIGHVDLFAAFLPVYGGVALAAMAGFARDRERLLARVAGLQFAVLAFVYGLSHAAALATLHIPGFDARHGGLLVWFLLVTQSSEMLQVACGQRFGKRAAAPVPSPDKTWQGLVGGAAFACALGIALHGFTPFAPWQAAALAPIVVLAGFVGGLAMSAVERRLGVAHHDAGIAGQGGLPGRVASVVFSAPVFFHLVRFWFAA